MKVLVVSFSKCGTKTLASALRTLGYSVYDFEENQNYLREEWIKIMTEGGTKEDFYRMYKDVDAATDIPACLFWEEISEAFPDVKLIFTCRNNEDEWLKSYQIQMKAIADDHYVATWPFLSWTAYKNFRFCHHAGRVAFCCPPQRMNQIFQGASPTVAKKRYRDHNTSVLQRAPKDRLLKMKLSDGWEPLCKFLEKPIPSEQFPHKNIKGSVMEEFVNESPFARQMKREVFITKIAISVLLAVVAFFLSKSFF
uniref:uncharacterized protein LOC120329671 isoform X1 n=1 Tax=Styela clava TaxID=7725 RepID=UPI00193A67DF|nr:uncharacterized protein LOC120329671 isoform X1 [Styela clava]